MPEVSLHELIKGGLDSFKEKSIMNTKPQCVILNTKTQTS